MPTSNLGLLPFSHLLEQNASKVPSLKIKKEIIRCGLGTSRSKITDGAGGAQWHNRLGMTQHICLPSDKVIACLSFGTGSNTSLPYVTIALLQYACGEGNPLAGQ